MKVIKKALMAVAIIGLSSTTARADWYNVQFSYSPQDNPAVQYSGAGVDPASGNWWNLVTSTNSTTSLYNSLDAAPLVPVSIALASNVRVSSANNGFTGQTQAPLFGGYAYTLGSSNFSFQGLNDKTAYTLYVYTQSEQSGETLALTPITGSGTISNGGVSLQSDATKSAFSTNQNYLTITNAHSSGGVLSFNFSPGVIGSDNQGNINGIQLYSAPAPEPSTIALMGMGGLLFVAFRLKSRGILSACSE